MTKQQDAYKVIYKGQKFYFECSFRGLKAIQKMAMNLNVDLVSKYVKVSGDKELIHL